MRRLAAAVPLAIAVAGCLASSPALDPTGAAGGAFRPEVDPVRLPAPDFDFTTAIDPDHGGAAYLHAVPSLHTGEFGLKLVGYNPLTRPLEEEGPLSGDSAFIAIDVWRDLVCVTHFVGSTGLTGGATIVNVSDPYRPVVLSSVESTMLNSDCQFSDDGTLLFLASYTGVRDSLLLGVPPPAGDVGAQGVDVFDVTDPIAPRFLFHDAQGAGGNGYHNVFTATIDDVTYVFQTYTGQILKVKDDRSGLEPVATVEHSDHDIWVGRHPVTGAWTMVTGAGYGTAVIDVEDPATPELLGVWEGDEPQRSAGWHRQWPLENTVDGRAYLVVAGEECGNGDTLPYTVLDWTDPTNLTTVGTWWIPGQPANDAPPHMCEMNSHEFEVWNGYVASGNYHAGVWVFDVGSAERAREPVTIGYYLPHEDPQDAGGTTNVPFVWAPNTWGAYFDERGYVITADWHSGLYVLEIPGATPGIGVAHSR